MSNIFYKPWKFSRRSYSRQWLILLIFWRNGGR